MKKLSAAVLAASLFATAEPMDIATIKCSDLAAMPPEGISMLLTWIDGYMGGQATDTAFDLERMQANIDGAATVCGTSPNATLMEVLNAAENG